MYSIAPGQRDSGPKDRNYEVDGTTSTLESVMEHVLVPETVKMAKQALLLESV